MSGRRFSVANFKAGGLTHMTSEIADALSSLCVTSGPHGGNPGEDKKVEATHTLQQRPLHFFQDDEQGGDQGGGDGDATPPLSESEQKEFDAIGSHIPALQDLHPHLRRLLYHRMHHLSVRGGHCVILQGELSDAWFILLRGSLQCIVSKTLAVDQCIAKAQIGSSDEADKHLAAVAASSAETNTVRIAFMGTSSAKGVRHTRGVSRCALVYFADVPCKVPLNLGLNSCTLGARIER